MSSTEIATTHPATGEVLDLASTGTEGLAELVAGAQEFRRRLADFEREISDELLARLDRDARWTLRAGGYEIKAPSPAAGTDAYPPDLLEAALEDLIAEGIITEDAATNACSRRLLLELAVPWDADTRVLADAVKAASTIKLVDATVTPLVAEPRTKVIQSGINALRKIPGTAEALDGARVQQEPPRRKVTVRDVPA